MIRLTFSFISWMLLTAGFLPLTSLAGTSVLLTTKEAKAVLPPVITPEENPWHLSAGLLWRQMEGVSTNGRIQTATLGVDDVVELSSTSTQRQSELDGPGAFLMLESPAFIQRGPAALNLSLIYSWAGMGDQISNDELPGRSVRTQFALDLHTISIGPRFVYETPRVRLSTSAGFAMNWVRWQAESTLRSTIIASPSRMHTQSSGTFRPSLYLDAMAQIRLTQRWFFLVGGRYDWVESIDTRHQFANDQITYQTNLSGWSLLAGLTYRF
jgi:outer membrane receptor protein involved in Fe transport